MPVSLVAGFADRPRRLLKQIWPIEPVTAIDERKAREIIARYEDKTFSYNDATTFALMERLGLKDHSPSMSTFGSTD